MLLGLNGALAPLVMWLLAFMITILVSYIVMKIPFMNKILTIIIPTYNMEKYLRHCLDSLIIKENMEKVEVLVINDGSKDTSSAIGHEYQDKYPETFRVVDKENGNYGSCINRGLSEATGKYVKVLDADDSFDADVFNDYVKFLLTADVDLVVNNYYSHYENGSIKLKRYYNLQENKIFGLDSFTEKLSLFFAMHAAAYKTENLRAINYYQTEGVSYTDQEWLFMPMTTVKSVVYFTGYLYRYLVGREGQTMDPKVERRMRSHHIVGLKTMVKEYDSMPQLPDSAQKYIDLRIQDRIVKLYASFISVRDAGELADLKEVDAFIKENSPRLYSDSEKYPVSDCIKYRFIENWRSNGFCQCVPSYVAFLRKIDLIRFSIGIRLKKKVC